MAQTRNTKSIDIMVDNATQFYCTLQYTWCELFPVNIRDVVSFVLSKRPTLKFRDNFQIFMGETVIYLDKKQLQNFQS